MSEQKDEPVILKLIPYRCDKCGQECFAVTYYGDRKYCDNCKPREQ